MSGRLGLRPGVRLLLVALVEVAAGRGGELGRGQQPPGGRPSASEPPPVRAAAAVARWWLRPCTITRAALEQPPGQLLPDPRRRPVTSTVPSMRPPFTEQGCFASSRRCRARAAHLERVVAGLPTGVRRQRTDRLDAMVVGRSKDLPEAGVAGVDQVDLGQQVAVKWASPVGYPPVNWETFAFAWLLLSSARDSPQPGSTAAHRPVPEGPERSGGRWRRLRAGACAAVGGAKGHLTWPPPPVRGMPAMTRAPACERPALPWCSEAVASGDVMVDRVVPTGCGRISLVRLSSRR